MLMTTLVAGLNALSLPLLPLFTCARPLAGSQAISTVTQKMIEESFTPPARRRITSFFISYTPVQKPLWLLWSGFYAPRLKIATLIFTRKRR
jgi:hypothetical protein